MLHRCRVNVTWGPKEERLLITGVHTVADIYCTSCNTVLGWKYVSRDAWSVWCWTLRRRWQHLTARPVLQADC